MKANNDRPARIMSAIAVKCNPTFGGKKSLRLFLRLLASVLDERVSSEQIGSIAHMTCRGPIEITESKLLLPSGE